VAAAEHLVLDEPGSGTIGVADDHLLALDDHGAVDDAGVVGGPAAAPAQGLDLQHLHPVGEFDEPARPGEELRAEVGGDAEGEDVDVELVDHPGQLLDLLRRIELRLVADDEVHAPAAGQA
jgi:hypothetical protein